MTILPQLRMVTLAVPDVERTVKVYRDVLGMEQLGDWSSAADGGSGVLLALGTAQALAIIEPADGGDTPARRIVDRHGGGFLGMEIALGPSRAPVPEERATDQAPASPLRFTAADNQPPDALRDRRDAAGTIRRIDHVAVVVPSLGRELFHLGHLGLEADRQDSLWRFPDLGTIGAVIHLDGLYLEVSEVAVPTRGIFGDHAREYGHGIAALVVEPASTLADIKARLGSYDVPAVGPVPVRAVVPGRASKVDAGAALVVSREHSGNGQLVFFEPSEHAPQPRRAQVSLAE